jgi:O-antigen ligase
MALVLIFFIPWEDSITIASTSSLARLIGFIVAGCWLITIIIEGKFRKYQLFHALVMLFFLWNFLSLFWSPDVDSTLQRIKTYSQIFLLVLIYWEIFQKPENLLAGLQAYVLGGYVLVISTIHNYLSGNVAVQYQGRYSATGVNAVDMALLLILGLPISIPFAMQLSFSARRNLKGTILQAFNLLYIPLSIFAIILTGSRTSLVAILPFIIFMIFTQCIKVEQKILMLGILCVSILVLSPFIPPSVISRLETIGSSIGEGDLGGRVSLWRAGITALSQHPILGVGSGSMDYTIGAWIHNTFLSVATETGFIGFILFLSILGLVFYELIRLPRQTAGLWLTILMTWTIGVLSLSWEAKKVTWILLSFMIIEAGFGKQVIEADQNVNFSKLNQMNLPPNLR